MTMGSLGAGGLVRGSLLVLVLGIESLLGALLAAGLGFTTGELIITSTYGIGRGVIV